MGSVNSTSIPLRVIVVGAGITGSLLTYLLTKRNVRVLLIDKGQEESSSSLAAGIVNPVTGKNFVKSWNIDVFLPKAKELYHQMEIDLQEKIVYPLNIIRRLPNAGAENIWEVRKLDPVYEDFVEKNPDSKSWEKHLSGEGSYAEIAGSMRVDIRTLLRAVKQKQKASGLFWEENFDFDKLVYENNSWTYKDTKADFIVFCEGARGAENPFFKNQPFALSKGYAMEVKSQNHPFTAMFKDEIFLVPTSSDMLWVGGAYSSEIASHERDASEFYKIETKLKAWYLSLFEVVSKNSATRPTTKNRRPILIKHEAWNTMFFLNGMGTKGTSMAPYYTEKLADYIVGVAEDELFAGTHSIF